MKCPVKEFVDMDTAIGVTNQFPASRQLEALPASPARVAAYDVARGIAVLSMVMVNYDVIFFEGQGDLSLYNQVTDFLYGRAAALFVTLAGVGIGLMTLKSIQVNDVDKIKSLRINLFKRSLVLTIMGYLFIQLWQSDILHFYGLFLVVGAALLLARNKALIAIAFMIYLIFSVVFCFMEGDTDLLNLVSSRFLTNLVNDYFFSGMYSAFPWLSFMLVGLWLVKSGIIQNRRCQAQFLLGAVGVLIALEFVNIFIESFALSDAVSEKVSTILISVGFGVYPITPLFALSALASSIIVIMASLLLQPYLECRILLPVANSLANIGRLSLTIYVGHILIGLGVEKIINNVVDTGLYVQLYSRGTQYFTVSFCAALMVCVNYWTVHFPRGPLEWILRSIGGFEFISRKYIKFHL